MTVGLEAVEGIAVCSFMSLGMAGQGFWIIMNLSYRLVCVFPWSLMIM